MVKSKGGVKGSSGVKSSRFSKYRGVQNRKNVKTGIAAEDRVKDQFPKSAKVERVTPDKQTFDGGKPDLIVIMGGQRRAVEVKSVGEYVDDGDHVSHGRAQFLRSEIDELAKKNGVVVFEVRKRDKKLRESGRKEYYVADAKEVHKLLQGEKGEEVKLEYSQIVTFRKWQPKK